MEIKSERLVLRDLASKDTSALVGLVNDLEVTQYLAVVPYPYTESSAKWFIEHCTNEAKANPRESYELGITLKESGELIGCVGLTKVNQLDKKATLGYWLGKKHWRQGYMYEAVQRLLKFAFNDLGLQRIDVTASTLNEPSNGLIKKIGAKYEGTAKRYHCAKSTGIFHDSNMYGLLVEDWKEV